MRVGYARVSTANQNPAGQVEELEAAGVEPGRIVVERASGAQKRPVLVELVKSLRRDDWLVVCSMDRLGRHATDMQELIELLRSIGANLESLREGFRDIYSPLGRVVSGTLIAAAVLEREAIRERTLRGIQRAKARGQPLGRPPKLSPIEEQTALAWRQKGWTITQIAESLHCSQSTIDRLMARRWNT